MTAIPPPDKGTAPGSVGPGGEVNAPSALPITSTRPAQRNGAVAPRTAISAGTTG